MPLHDPNKRGLVAALPVPTSVKVFVAQVGERAVKTFCQTEAALLIAAGTNLLDTDWKASLSASGMAAVLSVLTTVGTGKLRKSD